MEESRQSRAPQSPQSPKGTAMKPQTTPEGLSNSMASRHHLLMHRDGGFRTLESAANQELNFAAVSSTDNYGWSSDEEFSDDESSPAMAACAASPPSANMFDKHMSILSLNISRVATPVERSTYECDPATRSTVKQVHTRKPCAKHSQPPGAPEAPSAKTMSRRQTVPYKHKLGSEPCPVPGSGAVLPKCPPVPTKYPQQPVCRSLKKVPGFDVLSPLLTEPPNRKS